MRSVYPKLRELVPELAVVSELLRNNLYDPMVAGQPIKMAELQTTVRNASLLSRIEEAVKEGHGDTVIRGGIVEVDEAEGVMADGGVDKMAVDDDEGSGGDNCADESTFTDEEGSSRVDP